MYIYNEPSYLLFTDAVKIIINGKYIERKRNAIIILLYKYIYICIIIHLIYDNHEKRSGR